MSNHASSRRARSLLSGLLEALSVLAFFTGVAVFATWPLARHPLGGFYGFGNDNMGGIWIFGWIHDAYVGETSASFSPELQAPFGWDLPEQALQPADKFFALVFGGLDQGLGAYNAQIFFSFVLAGCTMYLLARYLTGSPLASAFAGFVYTFSPFHLAQGMQYGALASIQWLPLFLLALIVFLRRHRIRDAVFVGAAFALVAATSYYQAWFLAWFALVLLVAYAVFLAVRTRGAGELTISAVRRTAVLFAKRAGVAALVVLVLLSPFLLTTVHAASEHKDTLNHPLTEAVRYSARPWMLFVPPHDNPIFGPHVRDWVYLHLYDNPLTDQSIYIGYVLLAFALIGLLRGGAGPIRYLLASGAVAGLVFLMGPYVPLDDNYWRDWAHPEQTRHLPSLGLLMFDLGPQFRFFSRAFVLVSLCLAPLAALGFARVERRLGRRSLRIALAAAAIALAGLEYTNAPPHVWAAQKEPTWVNAVRKLPHAASVADYPIAGTNTPRSLYYMFWQRKHGHPTVNPDESPAARELAADISSPDDPAAGKALHDAGIRYAVVHTALPPLTRPPYQPGLPDDSMPRDAGSLNPWLREVARTQDAVIYRVLPKPRQVNGTIVRLAEGFGASEPEGGRTARWLQSPTGEFTVLVVGKPRSGSLVLTLSSFAQPRLVSITFDGRPLAAYTVPTGAFTTRKIPLGRIGSGPHELRLASAPGPQSIAETTGSSDRREVSLRLLEPVVVRTRTGR